MFQTELLSFIKMMLIQILSALSKSPCPVTRCAEPLSLICRPFVDLLSFIALHCVQLQQHLLVFLPATAPSDVFMPVSVS